MVDHNRYDNTKYEPIVGNTIQNIEHSKEDNVTLTIYGLKKSYLRRIIYHIFSILLLGIPYLIFNWCANLYCLIHKKSKLDEATLLFVKDNLNQTCYVPILDIDYYLNDNHQHIRFFEYQHKKYVWNNNSNEFKKLDPVEKVYKLKKLSTALKGLTEEQENEFLKLYGPNRIDIEIKSYWKLFTTEVFHPFYVFQIFSIILWSFDEYYQYASCIFFLSVLSMGTSLRETRKQNVRLCNMVKNSNSQNVQVCRSISTDNTNGDLESRETKVIESWKLVPGDIISIPKNGCTMSCDAVLLNGLCIVNESMLTGESTPVVKTPPNMSNDWYSPTRHKTHTLFAGTEVLQARYHDDQNVLALVVRTGFETSKGGLIQSILYPKPMSFKFYQDTMRFVCFLFVVAAIGMSYCIYLYIDRGAPTIKILLRTLDIITIIVPPALPAAMTTGTVYSQKRLSRKRIHCTSPAKINMAGKLKLVCFDKTGTLTQEGLNFYAIVPIENTKFTESVEDVTTLDSKVPIVQALATCHSLTTLDGKISGDPLDLNMFEATKWLMEEPGTENCRYKILPPTVVYPPGENKELSTSNEESSELPYQIGIIRQFAFTSDQQSMSVICKILGAKCFTLYVKGAPEKIVSKCDPNSVPIDFASLLKDYALKGYRVLGLAYKHLDVKLKWKEAQKISREQVENNLIFLGFLVMQNTLKSQTVPTMRNLHSAKIRTVMITGDNIMTAISVGRECEMIKRNEEIVLIKHNNLLKTPLGQPSIQFELINSPNDIFVDLSINNNSSFPLSHLKNKRYHFAMDGATWTVLKNCYSKWIPNILLKGTIFARFGPEQKTQLVMEFEQLDYIVAMVGDGANDCGALKAAHIGISLSDSEASVAAPFTSNIQDISCVKAIALEGRCALVTNFAIFKYMAMYSFIQFISVLILYTRYSSLGDMQFLYVDLILTTSLAFSMGRQGPSNKLVPKRPVASLMSLLNIIPLMLQVIFCALIQVFGLYFLMAQKWYSFPILYVELPERPSEMIKCWDNTVIFSISCFQYITLSYVYSKGKPYRVSVLHNGLILIVFVTLLIFSSVILLYPYPPIDTFLELMPRKNDSEIEYEKSIFRDILLLFPIVHFIISLMIEVCVAERPYFKKFIHFITRKKEPKNKYKLISKSCDESDFLLLSNNDFDRNGINC